MRPRLLPLALILLCVVHLGLAQDGLDEGSIATDLAGSANDDLFRICQGGLSQVVGGAAPVNSDPSGASSTNAELSSGWHLSLEGLGDLDLALYSVGEVLFGSGRMPLGNVSEGLTASGILEGESLSMNILALNGSCLLQLRSEVGHGMLNGTYQGFSSNGSVWGGLATGTFSP
ncbi:MAG: hypothetical protein JW986_00725 [Methanotrichaceae archaeon]|nr:hypothetical protein [Methanotrichaceae archaeon]